MPGNLIRTHRALIAICCHPDLSKGDVSLIALLLEHHNSKTGRCDPGRTRLARLAGMDKASVSRRLSRLEKHGWITLKRYSGIGRTNAHVINFAKLEQVLHDFETEWGGDPEVTDSPGDGDPEVTDTVTSRSLLPLPGGHTNPLTNPLMNPLNNVQVENQKQEGGANPLSTERVGEAPIARQEEERDTSTQRTPRELTPDELATRRWRCDTMMHFIKTPDLEFTVDELPWGIAEAATAAELKRRGAGKLVVLESLSRSP